MTMDRLPERKSVHLLAFDHYLRTGERLTNEEWLARHERKFNPYHDEIGRFTSPPGVTVSWGSHAFQLAERPADRTRPARDASGKTIPPGANGARCLVA